MRVYLTFFLLVFMAGALKAEVLEESITLSQAIKRAVMNNHELLKKKEEIKEAQERLREVEGGQYPRLYFQADYSRYDSRSPFLSLPYWWQSIFPEGRGEYYSARLSLSKDLYSGGSLKKRERLAKSCIREKEAEYEVKKNELAYQVTETFYSLLLLEKKQKVGLKFIEDLKNKIKNRSKGDPAILKAELLFMKAEILQEQWEDSYNRIRLLFNQLLGAELNTRFSLNGEFTSQETTIDLSKVLSWAFQHRPELHRQSEQLIARSQEVSLIRSARMPVISLGATYEYRGKQFPLEEEDWWGVLNLRLPLFDGWLSWTREKGAKIRMNQAKIEKARIEDLVQREVKDAHQLLVGAQRNLNKREERLKKMEELRTKFPDSLEADEIYLKVAIAYLEGIYEVLIARAKLELAVGTPLTGR